MSLSQIIALLAEALQSLTNLLKKLKFSILIQQLKLKANLLLQQLQELLNYNDIIKNYMNQGMSRTSSILQGYQLGKISININEKEQLLQQSLIESYEIINKVREAFTKLQISYQLGIGVGQKNRLLLETSVSFNLLAPLLYILHRSLGYSIRIRTSQTAIKEIIENRKQETISSIREIEGFVPEGSTLYSAVYRYFNDKALQNGRAVGNWGNFYLAYRLLYNKSPKKNKYRPRVNTIAKAFSEVLSGGGKGGSFLRGGDVGTEQDKFGSGATLTSTKSIVNGLIELATALQLYLNTNSSAALVNVLTRKDAGSAVLRKARDKAIEAIQESLK